MRAYRLASVYAKLIIVHVQCTSFIKYLVFQVITQFAAFISTVGGRQPRQLSSTTQFDNLCAKKKTVRWKVCATT